MVMPPRRPDPHGQVRRVTPEEKTVQSVRAALARGDLLTAYDEVTQGRVPGHSELEYLEVLTHARLGDTDRGLLLYDQYGLAARDDVDSLSLKARLLKDQAFAIGPQPNRDRLMEACGLYTAIYRRTGSSYPAINAATLAHIAGRSRMAASLAQEVVEATATSGKDDYFALATLAEALLVLGDIEGAREVLARAIAAPDADVGARSTTVLQLQRLAGATGQPERLERLMELVRPPKVAMFCGNIFVGGSALEAELAAQMRELIERENVGFAYGALAAGSDILIAEQLLDAGAELHVVLPLGENDFLEQSVAPAGGDWTERYHACKARAASVTFASRMSFIGEAAQFAYGSKVTMGMTRLRARHLHGDAIQLVILEKSKAETFSSADVAAWRAAGLRSCIVTADRLERPPMPPPPPPPKAAVERGTYGLMFSDYPGFADLDEKVLPLFWAEVMGRAAQMVEAYSGEIRHGSTWGDALYIVFESARAAAAASLDLCENFFTVDNHALGVPAGTAMRIALHYGPTYQGHDPVTGRSTYYGTEVSRTARIEPVTPCGSVYVTEPFAAVLEMEGAGEFVCNYVGKTPLAKGYGVYPLYRLSRRPPDTPEAGGMVVQSAETVNAG